VTKVGYFGEGVSRVLFHDALEGQFRFSESGRYKLTLGKQDDGWYMRSHQYRRSLILETQGAEMQFRLASLAVGLQPT